MGGDKSASGEKYYEDHEKELEKEFTEIMRNVLDRYRFGGNKEKESFHIKKSRFASGLKVFKI